MRKTKKAGHPVYAWMAAAVLFSFAGISAGAADPARIEPERKGSITLDLYSDEADAAVTGGVLTLYQAASLIPEEALYVYTPAFADCTIPLQDVTQASLAEELDAWVGKHAPAGMAEAAPDADGRAVFSDLPVGLYLVRQTVPSAGYERISPFLVTLPFPGEDGWIYEVDAGPKVKAVKKEPEEGTEPETETETESETEPWTEPQSGAQQQTEAPRAAAGSVKTGDETPIRAMIGLLTAAAVLLAVPIGYRCRRRRE